MEDLETVLPGGVQVTTLEPARDKDGHITLHLRVAGPARPVDRPGAKSGTLQALLESAHRGRKLRDARRPGQRMEPVSASNRFNFDLLADYNPATPGERRAARAGICRSGTGGHRSASTLPPIPRGSASAAVHRPGAAAIAAATADREARNEQSRRRWRERLTSPLTWHYAGVVVLSLVVISAGGAAGHGLVGNPWQRQRCNRRQAGGAESAGAGNGAAARPRRSRGRVSRRRCRIFMPGGFRRTTRRSRPAWAISK